MSIFTNKNTPAQEESPIISEAQTLKRSRKAKSIKKAFASVMAKGIGILLYVPFSFAKRVYDYPKTWS